MACRKAAYRAMTEMSEWKEKQQERAQAKAIRLRDEQRRIWTPESIFEDCCSAWLADGPEILGPGNHNAAVAARGCSGGCGKDHPRIMLNFVTTKAAECANNEDVGEVEAVLSHDLDPFVRYFQNMCDRGQATKTVMTPSVPGSSGTKYQLKGFLQTRIDEIKKSAPFPYHLVKVSPEALARSQRAHARQMDLLESERRATRRRKLQGTLTTAAAHLGLLEAALDVCYVSGNLHQHLDLAEIAWMRLTCKTMAKVAARMATYRLTQQVQLSYSVRAFSRIRCQKGQVSYLPLFHLPSTELPSSSITKVSSSFVPAVGTAKKYYIWGHQLPLSSYEQDGPYPLPNIPDSMTEPYDNYFGHRIQVFLESLNKSIYFSHENECLFPNKKRIEVARYHIDHTILDKQAGIHKSDNGKFICNVMPLTEGLTDDTQKCRSFTIQEIKFDFNDLLGIYVRKKLPLAKEDMQETAQQEGRPATRLEKQYVKGLAKAVRESPGSAEAFEGMEGW